ncbi:MAG: hypothetical protein U5L01_16905 [Rheinheimera sp.]|nr:hypothetical protein [Rheinheimera sp.]
MVFFAYQRTVEESMQEFNQAWYQLGQQAPQLEFLPTATVIKAAKAAGLVLQAQQRTYQVFFPDVVSLSREFKQIGANYTGNEAYGSCGGKSTPAGNVPTCMKKIGQLLACHWVIRCWYWLEQELMATQTLLHWHGYRCWEVFCQCCFAARLSFTGQRGTGV